jgi:SAM-dependent methyltransferase
MAPLPRCFTKGLLFGGVVAVLWGVLGNRRRRATVAGPLVEKVEAVPILGPRLYSFFAGRLMEGVYRDVAGDVVREATSGELLELGAGPGYLATEIGKRNRDLFITAMNQRAGMVAAAESRAHQAGVGQQVKVARGDASDIPYSNEGFDYVVTLGGHQHWSAPELALAEIYRVLKPGGKAWIYSLRRELPAEGWDRVRERIPLLLRPVFDVAVTSPAERALTEGQIRALVARTPFGAAEITVLEVEMAGMSVPAITKATLQK